MSNRSLNASSNRRRSTSIVVIRGTKSSPHPPEFEVPSPTIRHAPRQSGNLARSAVPDGPPYRTPVASSSVVVPGSTPNQLFASTNSACVAARPSCVSNGVSAFCWMTRANSAHPAATTATPTSTHPTENSARVRCAIPCRSSQCSFATAAGISVVIRGSPGASDSESRFRSSISTRPSRLAVSPRSSEHRLGE